MPHGHAQVQHVALVRPGAAARNVTVSETMLGLKVEPSACDHVGAM